MKNLPDGLSPMDIRRLLQESSTMQLLREAHSDGSRAEEESCDQEGVSDPQTRAERIGRAAAEAYIRKAADLKSIDHSEWVMPE